MANKHSQRDLFSSHVFLFNFSRVVWVWLMITAATSLDHQLVALAAGSGGSNHKFIDMQREALLDFKAHLHDPFDRLSTWKPEEDEDCCKWYGVTCNNQTGHIIQLDLSSFPSVGALVGEISPSLLNLTYLNLLDLSGNSFSGTIPMTIGSLTNLRHLDLSLNLFTGMIPVSIGSLTELRHLDLSINHLKGMIPMFIGFLTELRHLDLSSNRFNGAIPRSIGSLPELRHLDLSYNFLLHGSIPTEFEKLTNLENLYLAYLENCSIENPNWLSHLHKMQALYMDGISLAEANHWVNAILSLRKLSYLSLRGCNLSRVKCPYSSSPNSSSSSSSIVRLDLTNNNLNSSMYHWLFPLTSNKLHTLGLSQNKLDGIPKYLGNLCSLESLSLSRNSALAKFPDFLNNLSGCTTNVLYDLDVSFSQFTGSLPNEIQMFSSLEILHLQSNHLNGTISEKVWELPKLHTLDVSSNSLRGAISENIGKSKLRFIYLSNNSLEGVSLEAHMANLSYIEHIDLSSCKQLGPRFPQWIQSLKNLTYLDIANAGILDTIPIEFWNMWPFQLTFLNLSSNNITGMVPDLLSNFIHGYSEIDLSSNNFYGPIPNIPSGLETLDLSNNKFSGGISFLCHIVDGGLIYLDLSNNSLAGKIPNCLWNFKELTVLNLGYNNFSGSLPPSIQSLIKLEVLYINNNFFSGELPMSLKKCTNINFLHLGNNRFSGNLPFWIGEAFPRLYALSLTSNNFFGTIPSQLCQLVNLQILDLSMNNINGTIPSCVSNLNAMVHVRFSPFRNKHYLVHERRHILLVNGEYLDHIMMKWQGSVREFTSTIGLLKSIDLSSNNLTGQIPYELTNLDELLVLNLSNNAIHGTIPQQIGHMKKLLALDLSRNSLSGGIPSSISEVTSLSYLDVSYNNFSGRIPLSTQLQTFAPSRYTGNVGLCGLPLPKVCPQDKLEAPPLAREIKDDGEHIVKLERWFYIGGATGFVIEFWITCSALLLNRRGRHAFFRFLDSLEDWFYVKLVVLVAKLQRVTCIVVCNIPFFFLSSIF